MQETSTSPATILQFRQDIEAQFRRQIRDALDVALKEELAAASSGGGETAAGLTRSIGSSWQLDAENGLFTEVNALLLRVERQAGGGRV